MPAKDTKKNNLVIRMTPEAYQLVVKRAQQAQRTPDEIANQIAAAKSQAGEHPYVESRYSIMGGTPIIKGTRVAVWQIAERIKAGEPPDEIVQAYAPVRDAAIFDAISYYYDHLEEIECEIEEHKRQS